MLNEKMKGPNFIDFAEIEQKLIEYAVVYGHVSVFMRCFWA